MADVLNITPVFKDENTNGIYETETKNDEPMTIVDRPYTKRASLEAAIAYIKSKMPGPISRAIAGAWIKMKYRKKRV